MKDAAKKKKSKKQIIQRLTEQFMERFIMKIIIELKCCLKQHIIGYLKLPFISSNTLCHCHTVT